ncbi:MAG TPA: hypothetical protein DIU28_06690 [Anabaena sp. UBA12330]|nr:hypothetical protein [Aphanizomenon flos-aquae UKL13-PB]HCQ21135.1 hypothetical protein [Anabaena sp. UBA12330]
MVIGKFSPITHYPLPITHYPLPITHHPLPITHHLLPITSSLTIYTGLFCCKLHDLQRKWCL